MSAVEVIRHPPKKSLINECGGKCMMHRLTAATHVCEDCELVMCPQCQSLHARKFPLHKAPAFGELCASILAKNERRLQSAVEWAKLKGDEMINEVYKAKESAEAMIRRLDEIVKQWTRTIILSAVKIKDDSKRLYEEQKRQEIKVNEIKWLMQTGKHWTVYVEDRAAPSDTKVTLPSLDDIYSFESLRRNLFSAINDTFKLHWKLPDLPSDVASTIAAKPPSQKSSTKSLAPVRRPLSGAKSLSRFAPQGPAAEEEDQKSAVPGSSQFGRMENVYNVLKITESEESAREVLRLQPLRQISFLSLSNYAYGDSAVSLVLSALRSYPNIVGCYISSVAML